MGKSIFLRHIENNGLIIISISVAVIYWLFDALFAGVVFTRLLMIVLFIAYGAFTQFLINSHKDIELALKKAHDGLEEQVKIRTAELIKVKMRNLRKVKGYFIHLLNYHLLVFFVPMLRAIMFTSTSDGVKLPACPWMKR